MKKKGLLIFGGATYLLSLLIPATVTTNNSVVKATTIAATQPTNAQYNSTLVVPVTTGSAITACEKISTDGTLSPTNAEDIYELDVQESALNVSLSGSLGNNPGYFYVSICSPTGEELTNFTVSNTTAITDTATGRRSDSIQSISLSQGKYLCKVAFRHDWNNHAMILQSLLQMGEYDKVTNYFEQLCSMPMLSVKKILTGNEQENIAVSYNGSPLNISFMEPVDICTLFSNLVDNAIEACKKCKNNRYLQIHTSKNEHLLLIVLKNTRKETTKIEGIIPKTTKAKKSPCLLPGYLSYFYNLS